MRPGRLFWRQHTKNTRNTARRQRAGCAYLGSRRQRHGLHCYDCQQTRWNLCSNKKYLHAMAKVSLLRSIGIAWSLLPALVRLRILLADSIREIIPGSQHESPARSAFLVAGLRRHVLWRDTWAVLRAPLCESRRGRDTLSFFLRVGMLPIHCDTRAGERYEGKWKERCKNRRPLHVLTVRGTLTQAP
jgi:hypothetical protein